MYISGCEDDPATGESQVLVTLQEKVHHPQRQEEAESGQCAAKPIPH